MDGTLTVDGSIVSPVTVNNGATLDGSGVLGGVEVRPGGVLAPGNSIGTQTVNGPLTLNPGAIFEVEANAAGQSDKVIVNGPVDLTGSVLKVMAEPGKYNDQTSYLIIDNQSSTPVDGTFGQVSSNLAFLDPTVQYTGGDGNDVFLTLTRNDISFVDVARTPNQRSVASALYASDVYSPLVQAILNQTPASARQAYDALSGEVHATLPGVLLDQSRYVREAVLGRLTQAAYANGTGPVVALAAGGPKVASLGSKAMALGPAGESSSGKSGSDNSGYGVTTSSSDVAFWMRAQGAWGDFEGDGNAASATSNLGSFLAGIDARIADGWRLGLATGYSQSNINIDARNSGAEVDTIHLAAYAGGKLGPVALRSGGGWGWNDIDTDRAVIFPGFFERETAAYHGGTGQIFGEVAIPLALGSMGVEAFAGLAFVHASTDSFQERGDVAALNGKGNDEDVGYSTVGIRAATTMRAWNIMVTPYVSAAWQHAFDDVTPGAALVFASTGAGFGIEGVPLAQDSALVEAGLDLKLGPSATLGLSYSGQIGDSVLDNAVKGSLAWRF
jgi:outer membrane autotransporter protein